MRALVLSMVLLFGVPASAQLLQDGKSGRFMFNLHIGPSIGAKDAITMGAIVLDMGIAVDPGFRAYILMPLQFQFANQSFYVFGFGTSYTVGNIMVPLGFQYDIPIVRGVYISPRFIGGYAAFTASCNNCDTTHAGFIAPELSIKVVFQKRWNVGLHPFSLPIFFRQQPNGDIVTAIQYRILFFGGVNF